MWGEMYANTLLMGKKTSTIIKKDNIAIPQTFGYNLTPGNLPKQK